MDYTKLPSYNLDKIKYFNGFIAKDKKITDFNFKTITVELLMDKFPSKNNLQFDIKTITEVKNTDNEQLCNASTQTTFTISTADINSIPIEFFMLLINKAVSHLQGFVEFQSQKSGCMFGVIPDPNYKPIQQDLSNIIKGLSN